MKRQGL